MQITEAFECHNKTGTRQISSKRKSRRLSEKLHCLNFVFPAENETLGPVYLGCKASLSSVPLSMLKVLIYSSKPTFYCLQPNESSHRSYVQLYVTHYGLQPPVTHFTLHTVRITLIDKEIMSHLTVNRKNLERTS